MMIDWFVNLSLVGVIVFCLIKHVREQKKLLEIRRLWEEIKSSVFLWLACLAMLLIAFWGVLFPSVLPDKVAIERAEERYKARMEQTEPLRQLLAGKTVPLSKCWWMDNQFRRYDDFCGALGMQFNDQRASDIWNRFQLSLAPLPLATASAEAEIKQ